jgi:uncharacterized protein (TIGR00299 family) protein
MRLAYFDCFSGISGDMALGALVDAGADLDTISEIIQAIPGISFRLIDEQVDVRGMSAIRIQVESGPQGLIRTYGSIRGLLEEMDMPTPARYTAQRMYRRLAEAAALVHGKEVDLVTFHEFGYVDCLVDIVGCAVGLHLLGVERVFASPVPTGMGMMRTEHGIMPIPTPVVTELLRGVPTYSRGIPVELVTPTGAAILAAVSEGYGDMPMMRADHVGYGAGAPRLDFPNALRVVVGEEQRAGVGARVAASLDELFERERVLLEATTEGISAKGRERLMRGLEEAGASDVRTTLAAGTGGRKLETISAVLPASARDQAIGQLQAERGMVSIRLTPVRVVPTET